MTALLTDNLPLLAGAPNGIKKLRELILELAVRGKLVPHDSSDEPASKLLKRIAAEKKEFSPKVKKLSETSMRAVAFELPESWCWASFGDIAQHNSGKTLDKGKNSGVPRNYITTSNLYWGRFDLTSVRQMLFEEKDLARCTAIKNDLLICEGGEAGRAAVWDQESEICFQNHVHRARFFGEINPYYAQRYFERLNYSGEIAEYRKGVGISNLSSKALASIPVPVPPLAEQHRIVAKVDELMALCDRLEGQQADAESAHSQLVQALLRSLTQAADAEDFAASWHRLSEHFHTLFTTEPSIDALKQTLLQLAVMGKLVPQDPCDEPASELLKRLVSEESQLVVERNAKGAKFLAENVEKKKPFALPNAWEWCRVGDLISIKHGYPFSSSYFSESISSCVLTTPGNFFEVGGFRDRGERTKYYCGPVDQEFILASDDLIVAMTEQAAGLLGSAAFIPDDGKIYLHNQRLGRLRFNRELISPGYVFYYFNAEYFRSCVANSSTGMKVKHTSPRKIGAVPFPLPPIAEQHRIVAKVDQLMALCDKLKARLTQARQLNEQLATELVKQAMADNSRQSTSDQKTARTLLAAEITRRLHGQRTFGQRKLQKVIYLAEYAAKLAEIQGNYLRNVAGPHDRQLMDEVEGELHKQQWYERIERDTVGHAYRPLANAGQHRQAYESIWSAAERATVEQVIALMRDWDTDRCEMTVTLYAAWNDFILEGRPVTDESIVDEVMHRWNDAKLRFSKAEWLEVLAEMKKRSLLTPSGFGKRTTGGTLTLPGFE